MLPRIKNKREDGVHKYEEPSRVKERKHGGKSQERTGYGTLLTREGHESKGRGGVSKGVEGALS